MNLYVWVYKGRVKGSSVINGYKIMFMYILSILSHELPLYVKGTQFLFIIINIFCRYSELVYPIWHKTHFQMTYIYMSLCFVWIFGIGVNASYMIPTGKVIKSKTLTVSFSLVYFLIENIGQSEWGQKILEFSAHDMQEIILHLMKFNP